VTTEPEDDLMEMVPHKRLHLLAGRSTAALAAEIADELDTPLGGSGIAEFANGEIHCKFTESLRGTDVFIIQTHVDTPDISVNDAILEQLIMIDAARRASAKRITAVVPFYGYARQDRKSEGREPITAKLVANLFTSAGASRLVSVDLHSGQIQGFFDSPVDHLTAMPVLIDYLADYQAANGDLVIVSPDAGRVKVAERYSLQLGADLAFVHKSRVKGAKNQVEAKEVIGSVEGRACVLIDDMIDTAGTIVAAADVLMSRGATSVFAAATHGVLSGPAVARLQDSVLDRVVITNTLPVPDDHHFDKLEILSVAKIIADAIRAVFSDTSVSEIFDGQNQT